MGQNIVFAPNLLPSFWGLFQIDTVVSELMYLETQVTPLSTTTSHQHFSWEFGIFTFSFFRFRMYPIERVKEGLQTVQSAEDGSENGVKL